MRSCDFAQSKTVDVDAQKAADLAWDEARIALTKHVASHPMPGSAEAKEKK